MWHVKIIETEWVSRERVVIINDAVIADSTAFGGIFKTPNLQDIGYQTSTSGRKVVPVSCHWEGSEDGDDFIDLMVLDSPVCVVENYDGMVIKRVGCLEESNKMRAKKRFASLSRYILNSWWRISNGR